MKQRIGILGGTFNPVHLGHLILAQGAFEAFDLTKVIFVPSAEPPHKRSAATVDAAHRMAMVELAVEDSLFFEVSDIEIQRSGRSYAIDTVRGLLDLYPAADLFFIIGTDTLKELRGWKDIYSLLPLCNFVSFSRPQHDAATINADQLGLNPPWPERLLANVVRGRQIEISSSNIRYRIAEELSIHYLVPPQVEMYITEHSLYVSN